MKRIDMLPLPLMQELRKIIPVPAVNAALINKEGKVLLTRRSKVIRQPGKWCLPGGHLEIGEAWAPAIVREIQEEVGVRITKYHLMGIYSDPSLTIIPDPTPEGSYIQFMVALFRVTEWEREISPNYEVDAWDWFTPDALPSPMIQSHPIRTQDAYHYKGGVYVR